jgi:hypothetical protein
VGTERADKVLGGAVHEQRSRPSRAKPKRREAHLAVARLVVDGSAYDVRRATLDVYHAGPDFEDLSLVTWEVHFVCPDDMDLPRGRSEGLVTVETREGRVFSGKAVVQHVSRSLCTVLDLGEGLDGLESSDLTTA